VPGPPPAYDAFEGGLVFAPPPAHPRGAIEERSTATKVERAARDEAKRCMTTSDVPLQRTRGLGLTLHGFFVEHLVFQAIARAREEREIEGAP
jgi:hypothetical protein